MSVDLGSIRTLQQAELELRHPATAESLGVWFVLAGPEHPSRKRVRTDVARKLRDQLMSGSVDEDDTERAELEVLVAATLGWHGPVVDGVQTPVTLGGAPLAYSADAARALYENPELHWLRQQVRAAVDRASLFIGGSPSA